MPDELKRHTIQPEDFNLLPAQLDDPAYIRDHHPNGACFLDSTNQSPAAPELERLEALAIPPAWTDVWAARTPQSHILAYGTDEAGRRQYVYHPKWRAACEAAKFADLALFASRLPRLRRRVRIILKQGDSHSDLGIAAIIRLLDRAGLRIGNWRSDNHGAVTLTEDHINIDGHELSLDFKGKGGKERSLELSDPFLADAIEHLSELPSTKIFATSTQDRIRPRDVNAFIRETMGYAFSAKDFRTWGGSVRAASQLFRDGPATITALAEAAAEWLGNTPAIARSSYIHPRILDLAPEAPLPRVLSGPTRLRQSERACFAIIETADPLGDIMK
jgi:DNA topoisomerase-1